MDLAFKKLNNKIILIYLDDLTVFSKHREDHFDHLELLHQKCIEFWISLNLKKCIFRVPQGKLLGNIVSKEGVFIDPDRVKAIKDVPLWVNKKGVQFFLGKVNFVSCFIFDFTRIIRPITLILKKIYISNGLLRPKKILIKLKMLFVQLLCCLT